MSNANPALTPLIPLDLAPHIASQHIPPSPTGPTPASLSIELSQARHRIRLLNACSSSGGGIIIPPGACVLELGCGQGTCTAVLAVAVDASGHVDAVDPAGPEYGSPVTLGEAQGHLSRGEFGGRISWHRRETVEFLRERDDDQKWDVAVLVHCIWYFRGGVEEVRRVLAALRGRVGKVLVAEYAVRATERDAGPHVLASIARAALEAQKGRESGENIQTLVSPALVREVAEREGWRVEREGTVVPEAELDDGRWEVGTVIGGGFLEDVGRVRDDRLRALLRSARDAVHAAVEGVGGLAKVRTMDVSFMTLVDE